MHREYVFCSDVTKLTHQVNASWVLIIIDNRDLVVKKFYNCKQIAVE